MTYSVPNPREELATRVAIVSYRATDGQNTFFINARTEFSASDLNTGASLQDADLYFQHVLDHMASMPAYPGLETLTVEVSAYKSYPTDQTVTPTS